MSLLSRAIRKNLGGVKRLAVRAVSLTPAGGAAAKVLSVAKTLGYTSGGMVKKSKTRMPRSMQTALVRATPTVAPVQVRDIIDRDLTSAVSKPRARRKAKAKAKAPAKAKAKATTAKQSKSAQKYAQWKAAGKPGTFFEWVKANRG